MCLSTYVHINPIYELDTAPEFVKNNPYGHVAFKNEFVLVHFAFENKTANRNTMSNKYFVLIGQFWGMSTGNCTCTFYDHNTCPGKLFSDGMLTFSLINLKWFPNRLLFLHQFLAAKNKA